ncbi:MAG: PLD nuclease N-terminal domain-containing protein [Thermoleophilia bacterium]|nr:PLD nuclease N-terminal domain-containing protein [Thermoleophilia bacterium]
MSDTLVLALAIIPIALIEFGLVVWALVDLSRRTRVKGGRRLVWLVVILLFELIGPIVYLVWGREE